MGISDGLAFVIVLNEMVKEWNGLKLAQMSRKQSTHSYEYKVGPDPQALQDPRPDQGGPKWSNHVAV